MRTVYRIAKTTQALQNKHYGLII